MNPVSVSHADGVALIRIDNPPVNALSQEVIDGADGRPVTFTEIGPVELKGVPRTLQLYIARRGA